MDSATDALLSLFGNFNVRFAGSNGLGSDGGIIKFYFPPTDYDHGDIDSSHRSLSGTHTKKSAGRTPEFSPEYNIEHVKAMPVYRPHHHCWIRLPSPMRYFTSD